VDGNDDAIAQAYFASRRAGNFLLQHRAAVEEGQRVVEHNASLLGGGGEHQHHAALTTGELVLDEEREVAGQRSGHATLATTAADDAPQFPHALERQHATTGDGGEGLTFFIHERQLPQLRDRLKKHLIPALGL
jgi:hypothetical protein